MTIKAGCGLILALAVVIAGAGPAYSAKAPTAPLVIAYETAPVVRMTVGGQVLRLRVDPDAPPVIIINNEVASRLKLVQAKRNFVAVMGSTRLRGVTKVFPVTFEGAPKLKKARVLWGAQDYAPGYDGVVSMALLGDPKVVLRRGGGSGVVRSIPVTVAHRRIAAQMMIGGKPVSVMLAPRYPLTLANRPAADLLAREGKLVFTGRRSEAEIAFGVKRPTERADLSGFAPLGRPLHTLYVRSRNPGPPEREGEPDPDEVEEVTVVGKSEAGRRNPPMIFLGADYLAGCSEIAFDARRRVIDLRCD